MRNVRQQVISPVRNPHSLCLAQPGIFRIFLFSCSVHGMFLFVCLVLVFVGRAVCGILLP